MSKKRNTSIDILKFLAVILITNSHFDAEYVHLKQLATGGAIGDVLFFFCSGYTLFLGRLGSFDTWYKRRIRRIYPSVFALALLSSMIWWGHLDMFQILTVGGEWFVSCIMIYYVFLYFIRRYFINRINLCYVIVLLGVIAWYFLLFDETNYVWIYKNYYIKWLFYFIFMLMGAQLGMKESLMQESEERHPWRNLLVLVVETVVFYGIQIFSRKHVEYSALMIISLIPLVGVCYTLFQLSKSKVVLALYQNKYVGWVINAIGGLCLEVYLVQPYIRTTSLNHLFPLNLLILFAGILIMAYICRSLGRIFQQTFSNEDGYNWKEIFKII